jgi:4-hydroxybenzoate polyprenyltransferase
MLIEIGRKLRAPGDEREGVDTYTDAWGLRVAPAVWLVLLAFAATLAIVALRHVGRSATLELVVLGIAFAFAAFQAIRFMRRPGTETSAAVDRASQLWMFATYLALGTLPFVVDRIAR